jgi:hypothetical protein
LNRRSYAFEHYRDWLTCSFLSEREGAKNHLLPRQSADI